MRILLCWLLLAGLALAQVPSVEEVRSAILAFKASPLSVNPGYATITRFAEKSDTVRVGLNKRVAPWIDEPESNEAAILLRAFVAGNVEAQLRSGKAGDQPEAGLTLVFQVYRQIRAKNPAYRSPGVEKLQALANQGTLKAYLEKH